MYKINTDYIFSAKASAIFNQAELLCKKSFNDIHEFRESVVLPAKKTDKCTSSQGCGGVVDANGEYVKISKTKARVEGKYDYNIDDLDISNLTVVFCGYYHKAWGHFITESISRLWYALEKNPEVDRYVFIGDYGKESCFSGNYLEFLKLLGIADKTEIIIRPTKYKKVIIPDNGFVYNEYYTEKYVQMFNTINERGLSLYDGEKYEKVFFSKRLIDSSIMSNINEKVIDTFFKQNGYKIFYPERLSLIDTIGILQNARFFAGLTSSLSHNLLFADSNTTMISIEKQAFHNPYQVFVGKIKECETIYIDACRHLFPVCAGGPFFFDYTEHLDKFAKDFKMIPGKRMSKHKYRKNLKKYFVYYFDLNNKMPPDYMYRQYVIDMAREMYDDTIEKSDVFMPSLYQRGIIKCKKIANSLKRKMI